MELHFLLNYTSVAKYQKWINDQKNIPYIISPIVYMKLFKSVKFVSPHVTYTHFLHLQVIYVASSFHLLNKLLHH